MIDANAHGLVPIGGVVGWLKTYGQKATGTNTSTSANQLIDSGANFIASGVKNHMIVKNNNTAGCGTMHSETNRPTGWSLVTAVCTTDLMLQEDIFPVAGGTGKTYFVYAMPFLPDNFVECNGQTLSDTESLLNGQVIPDLNACAGTSRFLRGKTTSGASGGTETHSHTVTSHDHSLQGHTHTVDSHTHPVGSHTHTVPGHTHTVTPATVTVCTGATGSESVGDDTQVTTSSAALTTDASSGNTGAAAPATGGPSTANTGAAAPTTDAIGTLPSYYEVVWVMRIK